MSEEPDTTSRLFISHAGAILAAIPALGFVLAISKEASFFYFLGVDMGQILDTSDIIRSSALNVLPAIPILLLSLLSFTFSSLIVTTGQEKKIEVITSDVVYYIMLATIVLSAGAFLLLGIAPESAVFSIAVLVFLVLIREFVRLGKPLGASFRAYIASMVLLLVVGNFIASGALLAFKVRSGNLLSFPLFEDSSSSSETQSEVRLIRRFSEGVLLLDYQNKLIYYKHNTERLRLTYNLKTEPYRGLFCYSLGWCWASGWTGQQA